MWKHFNHNELQHDTLNPEPRTWNDFSIFWCLMTSAKFNHSCMRRLYLFKYFWPVPSALQKLNFIDVSIINFTDIFQTHMHNMYKCKRFNFNQPRQFYWSNLLWIRLFYKERNIAITVLRLGHASVLFYRHNLSYFWSYFSEVKLEHNYLSRRTAKCAIFVLQLFPQCCSISTSITFYILFPITGMQWRTATAIYGVHPLARSPEWLMALWYACPVGSLSRSRLGDMIANYTPTSVNNMGQSAVF